MACDPNYATSGRLDVNLPNKCCGHCHIPKKLQEKFVELKKFVKLSTATINIGMRIIAGSTRIQSALFV